MNPRHFLAATTDALAAASLPAIARPDPPKRTLRKAVMFGMVGEGSTVMDKFQILRDCGFEGAELDSPSELNPDEVLAAQEKTGLVVHGLVDSVHWQKTLTSADPGTRAEGFKALETCLREAKRFGSVSILLVPGIVDQNTSYDDAYTRSQAEIRKALPLAQEMGVQIAIENVWNNFLLSPLEAARYVDEFSTPLVAWHLDIGNIVRYGWPEQWVRILGRRIVKLHIKDFSRKKSNEEGLWKGFDVELGDGDAGWAETMKALDEIGYSTAPGGNWATAEVGGGDRKRLRQVSEQMDRLFAM
jgi:hexulose-6-phosphate isomerase